MQTVWERWTSLDTKAKSREIAGYYERLAETLGYESVEELETEIKRGKRPEELFGASQWKLIGRKFLRNRAAIIGGIVIAIHFLFISRSCGCVLLHC